MTPEEHDRRFLAGAIARAAASTKTCPRCHAAPGQPCHTDTFKPRKSYHRQRVDPA